MPGRFFSYLAVICLRSGDMSHRQKYTVVNFILQGIITGALCIRKRLPKGTVFCKIVPGHKQISENVIVAFPDELQVIIPTN